MKQDDIASVVQIDDPEIDVELVMARIREGLAQHALDEEVPFPTFAVARARHDAGATRFSEELYYQLEQANLNYDQLWVELSQVESHAPLLGSFVNRFKRELHRLVVFYANLLGERQVTVNDALVRTLNTLVETLEGDLAAGEQEPAPGRGSEHGGRGDAHAALLEQVDALQREVAQLRARLEKLEAGQGPAD